MADETALTEHRFEPPTDDELALELAKVNMRRNQAAFERWQASEKKRKPKGAPPTRNAFRALRPGPRLQRDPHDIQLPFDDAAPSDPVVDDPPPRRGAGAAPFSSSTSAKPAKAVSDKSDWRKTVEAIGKTFIDAQDRDGTHKAREQMRNDIFRNAHRMCSETSEVINLWRFALDIDGGIGNRGADARPVAQPSSASALRKWLDEEET